MQRVGDGVGGASRDVRQPYVAGGCAFVAATSPHLLVRSPSGYSRSFMPEPKTGSRRTLAMPFRTSLKSPSPPTCTGQRLRWNQA